MVFQDIPNDIKKNILIYGKKDFMRKKIIFLVFLVFICIVFLPFILNVIIFENNYVTKVSNDGWASFFGSYIGGVIGGIGTLVAMVITVRQTQQQIIDANEKDRQKERVNEANEVAKLVTSYIADVEIYYNVVTENGPVLVDPDSGEPLEVNTFLAGDKIKIVTPEYDDNGWKLAYIVDKDNNIVTYDSEYITFINSNLYFKAIYMEEEVPKEPIVGFRGDKYELNPDSGRILFLTTIDVPDEFAVLEWGCLVSTKSDELSYPDSYSVKETNPSVQNSTYADSSLFMDNANWFTQQRLVRVKAYAVLLDKNGNTQVIYSDLVRIQL